MNDKRLTLLFVTQKIDAQYHNLAATIGWIHAFVQEGFDVRVVCLERGQSDLQVPIYSLGKEKGYGRVRRTIHFLKLIISLRYDRVFVHMNSEYVTLGGWYWYLKRIPIYLWYTHYARHIHIWMSAKLCRRLFAATPQSMPQLEGNPKRVILGHGVDPTFWLNALPEHWENANEPVHLLCVHRICRSKRVELSLQALMHLPERYTLTIYGKADEPAYEQELRDLVKASHLEERVTFAGVVSPVKLRSIFPKHRLLVNMAMETIDKTMVEALLFGLYVVTTPRNAAAIGLPFAPINETPEAIASFILDGKWATVTTGELQEITKTRHSTAGLIHAMSSYIRAGT